MQENNRNYGKGALTLGILRPVAGNGLFLSEGEFWLRQRRLMQPTFHHRHVAAFGTMMVDATQAMLDRWEAHAASGRPIDIMQEMSRLTLEIVSRALFSTPAGDRCRRGAGGRNAGRGYRLPFRGAVLPTAACPHAAQPAPTRGAARRSTAAVYGIIAARRRGDTVGDDLLGLLMSVRDEDTGEGMSDQQLRDEVITLFVAGHETTAVALAWVWHLLAGHPDAAERVRAELAAVLGDRAPAAADLQSCRMHAW